MAMLRKSKGSDDPYSKALDLLTRRDHTSVELAMKLQSRGFDRAAIDATIDKLTNQGFIDDTRFAGRWVESALRSGRGFGPKLLADLLQKGVNRETAQQAVAAGTADNPAEQVLQEIVTRKFAAFNNSTATQKERQRIYNYLLRRGFQLSTILGYFRNQPSE
jgi:regulatory protein